MKRRIILLIGLFVIGFSMPTEAQILKKLGKKIEQKVNDRIDRKEREADQKTDESIDKVLDKTEDGIGDAARDATRSRKDKETSTSENSGGDNQSSAATGSAPGSLTDSANKDKIRVVGSGSGLYLEYEMDTDGMQQAEMPTGVDMGDFDMKLKLYSSNNLKRARSEVSMKIPFLGEMKTAVLSDYENQSQITILNDRNKTYSVMEVDDTEEEDMMDFQIENLGTETIRGLKTTHIRMTTPEEEFYFDFWTSKDLPGYKDMIDIYQKSGQMGDNHIWQKLIELNADGYVVRMESKQQGMKTRIELTKVEQHDFSSSLFEVPDNYKFKNKLSTNPFSKH